MFFRENIRYIQNNPYLCKKEHLFAIMQVLKKDIQDNIINTATRLFYNHGFGNASMRQIADELDMSVSNLYKYFKNKEDLFSEIVKGYYTQYLTNFKKFVSHEEKDSFDSDSNILLAQTIFNSIIVDHVKFVLLMDKSKGTKYENFKDEVSSLLGEHILQGISATNKQEYMVRFLVRNFFNGIVEIAKDYKNDKWALQNLNILVKYHMNGMQSLYK